MDRGLHAERKKYIDIFVFKVRPERSRISYSSAQS